MPVPTPPSKGASPATVLTFDHQNLWAAHIMECLFSDPDQRIYLLVVWLYWPEDSPMGRQPYHGRQKLVMSDHMDIIEAQTIAVLAEITK
jgi:hypothetical protein